MRAYPKINNIHILPSQSIPKPFLYRGFGMPFYSLLGQLFGLATPILMVIARKKKKSSKKRLERKPNRSAKRRKARPSRRTSAKKPLRVGIKPGKIRRGQSKPKSTAPSPKAVEEEEQPPPVAPIGRAILLVPRDATYVESLHPTFRWLSVGGSTKYEVQWGEDQTLATKYSSISLATEATIPVEKPLQVGAIYYWRVRGGNDAGWGPWSPISSFRVLEETA
jgi:hypothetical protein